MKRAEVCFQNKEFEKAYSTYHKCAGKTEDSNAAYRLGWMYENGKGVAQDPEKAIYWYKQAAKWNLDVSNKKRVYETIYRNVDPLEDEDSTKTLIQLADGKFGLRAYYPNYAEVSYTDKVPRGDPALEAQSKGDIHYINTEIKFQISLRADYTTEWFGFSQMWTGAYTQTSYWQIFIESSPFRETNYKPELFATIPFYHKMDSIGLKAISFGFKHVSNGQADANGTRVRPDGPIEGSRSRSWNRLYARAYFQWENFFAKMTLWYRIKEDFTTDDNPDILDYYGHGSFELGYVHKKLLTQLTLRPSFSSGHVTGELEMSYPVPMSDNVFFFLQGFSGYGQSLIDYDQRVRQIGFGLSISR
jgi:phospholipase A1